MTMKGCFSCSPTSNRTDVRVIEPRRGARFTKHALLEIGSRVPIRRKKLDSNLPVQPRVACQIDFAHPACAKPADDAVMKDRRWDGVTGHVQNGGALSATAT
jgi:hypothetical protein